MLPPDEYVVSVQSADIMRTAFQSHRANRIFEFPSCAKFVHHWRNGDISPARDIEIPVLNFVNPNPNPNYPYTNPNLTLD